MKIILLNSCDFGDFSFSKKVRLKHVSQEHGVNNNYYFYSLVGAEFGHKRTFGVDLERSF